MLFGHISSITPATVISIQSKLSDAKYASLTVQLCICLSNGRLWLFVHETFSDIFTYPLHVRDHARYISRASYQALCIHISTHMDAMWLFLLLIAIYINLVDLDDYTYKCTVIAFHYNKWNVRVFVFGNNVSASRPMNCFKWRPILRKKVYILMNISGINFLFPHDVIIHNEHIDEFWSDSKGSILQHGWAACDESCS